MMLLRLFGGVLIGIVLAFGMTFLFCGWLTPAGTFCGHNAPILLFLLGVSGTLLAWIVLFGAPLWKEMLEGDTDYRD